MAVNILIWIVAVGLVSLSLGQFLASGATLIRATRRVGAIRRDRLKRLRSATRVARLNSQLSSGPAPTDAKSTALPWRVMEVMKVVDESNNVKSFYLADPNRQSLPLFAPGQFVMVRPALAGKYQATRCYSLSVAPNSKLWRITVKRHQMPMPLKPDRRDGGLSSWLHDNIHEGDCLLIGGPSGDFYLPNTCREPLVLIAAGVGITPMVSMLQYSAHFTPQRHVTLHYQAQDHQHWPLGQEVHAYSKQVDTVRATTYFSRLAKSEIELLSQQQPGNFRSGHIAIKEIVCHVDAVRAHYYLCGPENWMSEFVNQLTALGIPQAQIHWESFGAASHLATNSETTGGQYKIQFARSDVSVQVSGQQSLWEIAQANDVIIPSGCLSGVCGACRVQLKSGSIKYQRPPSAILAPRECLSCIAHPESDAVVEI